MKVATSVDVIDNRNNSYSYCNCNLSQLTIDNYTFPTNTNKERPAFVMRSMAPVRTKNPYKFPFLAKPSLAFASVHIRDDASVSDVFMLQTYRIICRGLRNGCMFVNLIHMVPSEWCR